MDFFTEFERLKLKTPRVASVIINSVNSDYCHNCDNCKNCYLIANGVGNQDCMYGRDFYKNTDCTDCDHIETCTLCYNCVNCKECWNGNFLQDCANAVDCNYGYFLKDCKNCIGCAGLRKKEFHIFNKPYSKEEFSAKKASLTQNEITEAFDRLKKEVPRRDTMQINTENCFGDNILNSKDIFYGFDVRDSQDCGYVAELHGVKDSWDIFVLEYSELCYDLSSCYKLNNCNFCFSCWESNDLEFCEWVSNSQNCFGCVSLHRKEYHLLNQPYSKDEYFKKTAEIKDQLKREGRYDLRVLTPTYPIEDTVALWPRL